MEKKLNLNIYRELKAGDALFDKIKDDLFLDSTTLSYILREATNKDLLALLLSEDRRTVLKILLRYEGIRKTR